MRSDLVQMCLALILFLFTLFGSVFLTSDIINRFRCNNFTELNSNYEVTYTTSTGCMIKMDDIWLSVVQVYYDTNGIKTEK